MRYVQYRIKCETADFKVRGLPETLSIFMTPSFNCHKHLYLKMVYHLKCAKTLYKYDIFQRVYIYISGKFKWYRNLTYKIILEGFRLLMICQTGSPHTDTHK